MRKKRERRRSMEAAASRAAQKSLKMRRLIQRQRETGSYLAIALLCLTLIDMVGASVGKVCRLGGGRWQLAYKSGNGGKV